MKRMITDNTTTFTTFQLNNLDEILCSHRFISDISEKEQFKDEMFTFIDEAYDELGGFRSFKDKDRFATDSYLWYITYAGPQPISKSELDIDRVYVVSVFRKNHGIKLVGLARRKLGNSTSSSIENKQIRRDANSALIQHIKFVSDKGWAEVSDKLEKWFWDVLGYKYIIDPYLLKDNKIFKDIEVDIDEFHYYRPLRKNGQLLRKIAYGTIKI